jgi:hypothetical protein
LSKNKYQIIETPANVNKCSKPYLGILQNGVCFGIEHDHQLKIWILNESCGQMEWVLKYEIVVGHYLPPIAYDSSGNRQHDGSWTVEATHNTDHDVESLLEEENFEIQDIDYDDESLSEEENIVIHDTDYDDESLSEEENIEIQDTDDESLSEEENIEI